MLVPLIIHHDRIKSNHLRCHLLYLPDALSYNKNGCVDRTKLLKKCLPTLGVLCCKRLILINYDVRRSILSLNYIVTRK